MMRRDSRTQRIAQCIRSLVFAFTIPLSAIARGDAGVFTGTGQNLKLISTDSVQLVSIDVKIVLGRGRFLFDGSVPGMDQAEYDCRFVLRNLTNKACDFQVGFPIDSEFAKLSKDTKNEDPDWVSAYSFNARDDDNTYHVGFQSIDDPKSPYSAIFNWMMSLRANETRRLIVQYRIPISLTVASTSRRGIGAVPEGFVQHPSFMFLSQCEAEIAGYTTETGSSWSGNVEHATFTVYSAPFEKYLARRGFDETDPSDLTVEERTTVANNFPVHNVWSYREISPGGWHDVQYGVAWEYRNYKPKDAIKITYFLMQFPQVASEVDPWVDAILRQVSDPNRQASELSIAKQILLATYGKEPADASARAFTADQVWYAPKANFVMSQLSKNQLAVLAEIDRRIESVSKLGK
jgi:hypothetical protein